MSIHIESVNDSNKEYFLRKSEEFYLSDAVAHNIPYEYHQNALKEMLNSDTYIQGFVIKHNHENAGFAVLNKSFSREVGGVVIWIEELFIEPPFQGKGIGSYFFTWLEENFKAARYRLEVEPDNTDAKALYERLGYERLIYEQYIKDEK